MKKPDELSRIVEEQRTGISLYDDPDFELPENSLAARLNRFPWWLVTLVLIIIGAFIAIFSSENYREALIFITGVGTPIWRMGITFTVRISIAAYLIAVVLGLLAGLGRISRNIVIRNLATLYVETIRGIPMLVLIFFIAFVAVPVVVGALIPGLDNNEVPMEIRAITALSITYGAFLAEVFRAGIQSVGRGQMEAARSLGMSYGEAMRFVILPQAIRTVLPALGNDFVAMVKDSSLVSVLAVRDLTQRARLYAGRSFRFPESYVTLSVLYLTIVLALSLLVRVLERRMSQDE